MWTSTENVAASAAGDEPEQQLCRSIVERGEAQFDEDDQVDPQEGFDDLADGVVGQAAVEGFHQVLAAARGIDMRRPLAPSPASTAVIAAVRRHVEGPGLDRYLAPEIEAVVQLARSGEIVAAAESAVGELNWRGYGSARPLGPGLILTMAVLPPPAIRSAAAVGIRTVSYLSSAT